MVKKNSGTRRTKSIRVTKQELSDAGKVLGDKGATKKERTVAALLLVEARKRSTRGGKNNG
ncbi:MAG TPA: hypothetical protein VMR95_03330 [Candidatus Binatia bacterium]|nr:hypothetical protein [Candidatus Binatia bacterium]